MIIVDYDNIKYDLFDTNKIVQYLKRIFFGNKMFIKKS